VKNTPITNKYRVHSGRWPIEPSEEFERGNANGSRITTAFPLHYSIRRRLSSSRSVRDRSLEVDAIRHNFTFSSLLATSEAGISGPCSHRCDTNGGSLGARLPRRAINNLHGRTTRWKVTVIEFCTRSNSNPVVVVVVVVVVDPLDSHRCFPYAAPLTGPTRIKITRLSILYIVTYITGSPRLLGFTWTM